MPRVPTTEGPDLQSAPLPGAYSGGGGGAAALASNASQKIGQIADMVTEYSRQQQNKLDLDTVFRAETALKDDYLQFEQAELGKKGVAANGVSERAQQWWQESSKKYGEGMTERQRFAFDRSAAQLRQSSAQTLMRHERQQGDFALSESAQARVGSAIDMAITDPSPERLANSRKEITEAVSIVGQMAGLPPEALQAKLGESLSLMHRGVVMRLLDGEQTDQAKAYFYSNKKEIGAATALALEKSLETSGRLKKAQDTADEVMAKYGGDLGAATAYIEKTYAGEDEKAIRSEVEHRFTVQTAAKNKMSGDAYESAKLAVVQGKKPSASAWAQMDDGHKAAILELQQAKAKQWAVESQGKEIKTDFATYDTLNRLSWQDPQAFLKLDLQRYSDRMSRADLKAMSEAQQKVGTAEGVKGLATRQQQISTTIDQLKLGGEKNAEKRGALTRQINDAIEEETRRAGKPLKYDELQKVIDGQVMEVTVPGMLWDSTKRSFELTTEERATARVKVPAADRAQITEALRKRGLPVTEEAISALYARKRAQ